MTGATIYIDSYYTPSYGDKIIIPGYSNTVCEVTSADEVNIKDTMLIMSLTRKIRS